MCFLAAIGTRVVLTQCQRSVIGLGMLVGFRLGLGRQDCFVFRGWMDLGRSTVLFRLGCRRGNTCPLWRDRLCPHLLEPGSPVVGTLGTIRTLGGLGFSGNIRDGCLFLGAAKPNHALQR